MEIESPLKLSRIIITASQRVGSMLKKLSMITSQKTLRTIAEGLFYSKLAYCLPLFINTWGLDSYTD